MFQTLYKAFIVRSNFKNIYYKNNKVMILSSKSVADIFTRKLSSNSMKYDSNNYKFTCCDACKLYKCDCVEYCKKNNNEHIFKCELTNKPKRPGNIDCDCNLSCIVNKSETMNIHDNSQN